MSVYANDRRVRPHPGGTWMVFDHDNNCTEYKVTQLHMPSSWGSALFVALDSQGRPVPEVGDGSFDEVIHALIGDPR